MEVIDLRSDTVTKPSQLMRQKMAEAEVGDDVYGEDPTVNRLERLAAELLGKESALFAPSGTQTNLLALLSHCQRGDEYIVGQLAHTYKYEGGGGAVLGSIQPQPLDFEPDGTLDLQKVSHFVKPDDYHFAKTRLLCLENTHSGLALPIDYFLEAKRFVEEYGLKLHLDGARIFNAAVKCRVDVHEISQHFDSISVCLSKGLGAPVGSVLCGDHDTIARARRWRKMLGGGMRQAGILAAAAVFALEKNRGRLEEDHQKAQFLADELGNIEQLSVDYAEAQTNMVFVNLPEDAAELKAYLEEFGVLIPSGQQVRLVLHQDISKEDVSRVVSLIKKYFTA